MCIRDRADGWAYAFAELPKYADDGTEIAYTVREKDVPAGYEAAVSGHNIANTLKPQPGGDTVEVAGTKTWVDNDNAGTTRPETLTVSLYQNDKLFRTQETVSYTHLSSCGPSWASREPPSCLRAPARRATWARRPSSA